MDVTVSVLADRPDLAEALRSMPDSWPTFAAETYVPRSPPRNVPGTSRNLISTLTAQRHFPTLDFAAIFRRMPAPRSGSLSDLPSPSIKSEISAHVDCGVNSRSSNHKCSGTGLAKCAVNGMTATSSSSRVSEIAAVAASWNLGTILNCRMVGIHPVL